MSGAAVSRLLDAASPKTFRRGTHRSAAPAETLARVRPLARAMGITRLGNITGLDRIGIPVAIAVRPNSRSVSVSQGKGLDLPQAMASALMEACEGFHAEEIGPCRRASYRELKQSTRVADPARLCPGARPFDAECRIEWVEGYDLPTGNTVWVPAEIVHTDYTHQPDGFFLAGTNGLASGNTLVEAVNAALYELVERDAVALWAARSIERRVGCAVDLACVDDADCRELLGRYNAAGIIVRVWNITSDVGIAAFLCEIRDAAPGAPAGPSRFHGSGCHADRGIALVRALAEAAQTRLTYIAGVRDDLPAEEYETPWDDDIGDALVDALARELGHAAFRDAPNFSNDDLGADRRWALGRLNACGMAEAIVVDLTRAELAIPVVRLIVPGLEWDPHHPNYRPGPRALAQQ